MGLFYGMLGNIRFFENGIHKQYYVHNFTCFPNIKNLVNIQKTRDNVHLLLFCSFAFLMFACYLGLFQNKNYNIETVYFFKFKWLNFQFYSYLVKSQCLLSISVLSLTLYVGLAKLTDAG